MLQLCCLSISENIDEYSGGRSVEIQMKNMAHTGTSEHGPQVDLGCLHQTFQFTNSPLSCWLMQTMCHKTPRSTLLCQSAMLNPLRERKRNHVLNSILGIHKIFKIELPEHLINYVRHPYPILLCLCFSLLTFFLICSALFVRICLIHPNAVYLPVCLWPVWVKCRDVSARVRRLTLWLSPPHRPRSVCATKRPRPSLPPDTPAVSPCRPKAALTSSGPSKDEFSVCL